MRALLRLIDDYAPVARQSIGDNDYAALADARVRIANAKTLEWSVVDHTCRDPHCTDPDHLQVVDQSPQR